MNASELLLKLDLLSKRLDKIGGIINLNFLLFHIFAYVSFLVSSVTTSCVLGNRCPSVLKGLFTFVLLFHVEITSSPFFRTIFAGET